MRDRSSFRMSLHVFLALICTIAVALALGAVWTVVRMHFPATNHWFAVLVGIVMGYVTCAWITRNRYGAVLLAWAGTILAAVYMKCLFVGLLLAATMGLGYLYTLRRAGVGMLLALARASLDPSLVLTTIIGLILGGLIAWFYGRLRKVAVSHQAP